MPDVGRKQQFAPTPIDVQTQIDHGPYPIRTPLSMRQVEGLLAEHGFVTFMCDEAALPPRNYEPKETS